MFTYAYEIIKRRLELTVTELREIDWYLHQDSTSDKNAWLFAAPACFIEFIPGDVQALGRRIQRCSVDIDIHLLTENVMDSGKRMKKDQPTDHMRIFDKIHKNLHGFSSKISYLPEFVALLDTDDDQRILTSMTRSGTTPPHVIRKAMMKSVQRFSGFVYDHGGCMLYEAMDPAPGLEIEVGVELPGIYDIYDDSYDDSYQ